MKKLLKIVAAMLIALAAFAPSQAQEWERVNDSTWQRMWAAWPNSKPVLQTGTAITATQLAIETNRRNRQAGFCMLGSMGCVTIGSGIALLNHSGKSSGSKSLDGLAIGFGVAALGLQVAGVVSLIGPRVSVTPEGVVVKIGRQRKAREKKLIEVAL